MKGVDRMKKASYDCRYQKALDTSGITDTDLGVQNMENEVSHEKTTNQQQKLSPQCEKSEPQKPHEPYAWWHSLLNCQFLSDHLEMNQ